MEAVFPAEERFRFHTAVPYEVSGTSGVKNEQFTACVGSLYDGFHDPITFRYLFDDLVDAEGDINKTVKDILLKQGGGFDESTIIRANSASKNLEVYELFSFFLPRIELVHLFFHLLYQKLDITALRLENEMNGTFVKVEESNYNNPVDVHLQQLPSEPKEGAKLKFLFEDQLDKMSRPDYEGPMHIPIRDVIYPPPPTPKPAEPTQSDTNPTQKPAKPQASSTPVADSADSAFVTSKKQARVTVKALEAQFRALDVKTSAIRSNIMCKDDDAELLDGIEKLNFAKADISAVRQLMKVLRRRNEARQISTSLNYLIKMVEKKRLLKEVLEDGKLRNLLNRHAHDRIRNTDQQSVFALIDDCERLLGMRLETGQKNRLAELNHIMGNSLPYGREYTTNTEIECPRSLINRDAHSDLDMSVMKAGLTKLSSSYARGLID